MSKQIALDFVTAINNHDVPKILSLMSDDHTFIDTHGNTEDKTEMTQGWPGYFQWFPDYQIQVSQLLEQDDTIVLLGFASGTFSSGTAPPDKRHWRLPAAWRAVVRQDKVQTWQVFCDSKVPYEAMGQL